MKHIYYIKEFENTSHFNRDGIYLITTFIVDDAEALGAEGLPDNLYITYCDIDRIYLSINSEASPDSPPDYVIRMWDYYICEEDRKRVHMSSTFHIMKECSDGSGRCSDEQFDGDYDILVYGEIAKMRVTVLNGLTEIQIPDSVTVIPEDAFMSCPNLKEVHIPEGVTKIEPFAFAYCESLSRIDLPDSLTTIGSNAFRGCSSLHEIHIPDNVIEIGSDAFSYCDNLTEVSVPLLNCSDIGLCEETHISLRANEGLRQIPDGITCIPPEAFKNCSEIKRVRIPDSVTKIGWEAFCGCIDLKEVYIPDSLMSIGEDAFKGCNNLTEISIPLGLSIASASLEDSTRVVIRNNEGIRVLPEGVTEILPSAFKGCMELKRIVIPDSVKEIGDNAFNGCTGLEDIHISEYVTRIGEHAFAGCSSLTEIHIPDSVTEIGESAFLGCTGLFSLTVSPNNPVYDSRDNCDAILETDTGKLIADCGNTIFTDSWLETLSEKYVATDFDEPDEEIKALTIIKSILLEFVDYEDYLPGRYVRKSIADKFQQEWYKNYIGTKKIQYSGPNNYSETESLSTDDINEFIHCNSMIEFVTYRLKVGHTERQDRFTELMRDYPVSVLEWLQMDWLDWLHFPEGSIFDSFPVIPYDFYKRLAQGGDYELFGYSKDEFLRQTGGTDSEMPFEYVSVLEEKYGIDYAVDYLYELDWLRWYLVEDIPDPKSDPKSDPTVSYFINLFTKAIDNKNNEKALRILSYFYSYYIDYHFLAIQFMSRLATMWKQGLISDEWLTDSLYGLASIIDIEWGDDTWCEDEDYYPECTDDNNVRLWLLRLLESDFANDIVDYLKPLLEMVMEKEKSHNWETGKKAIESFLAKNSNK